MDVTSLNARSKSIVKGELNNYKGIPSITSIESESLWADRLSLIDGMVSSITEDNCHWIEGGSSLIRE